MAVQLLILEDDPGTGRLLELRLRRENYDVVIAQEKATALQLISRIPFDVFIVDYQLGDGTGLDFCKEARALGYHQPAILLTGYGHDEILIEALRAGVLDFIPKGERCLDHVAMSTARVLKSIDQQRELDALRAAEKVQEKVLTAFTAARIGSWVLHQNDGHVEWSGYAFPELNVPATRSSLPLGQLLSAVGPSQRMALFRTFLRAREARLPFDCAIRADFNDRASHFLVRGSEERQTATGERIATGVCIDISAQRIAEERLSLSLSEIQELNERLSMSLTETHHRIKNSLQMVSSLLSIELRKTSTLDEIAVKKIIGNIRALSVLHDLLTDQAKDGRELRLVNGVIFLQELSHIIAKLIGGFALECRAEPFYLSPRRASSLAVIINELVMNGAKYGSAAILCTVDGDDREMTISVTNSTGGNGKKSAQFDAKSKGTGLEVVSSLCKNDFSSELKIEKTANFYAASFTIAGDDSGAMESTRH